LQEEIENRTINLVISLTGYRKVSGQTEDKAALGYTS